MSGYGHDNNEVDSLAQDTIIDINIAGDTAKAKPTTSTPGSKFSQVISTTSLSQNGLKVDTATEKEPQEIALTLPIPPGTFQDTKFTYVEDDEVLEMIDSLIVELYQLKSCLDTGAARRNPYEFSDNMTPEYSKTIYAERLDYLNQQTPFSLTYNTPVHKFIELYASRRRGQVSRMLGLAETYFPLFEEVLDQYNMPLELKYLAIVESALNPSAGSRAGAKGLWQFMYRTGKSYGLEVTSYIDDRFDPYKSTVAACEYLQFLHGIYDNWDLALAAYNCGPGRVNRAIRRSGGKKDYWELWRYLPRETRGYVPAFIAVNYVMEYATEHNIYPTPPRYLDFQKDTVVIRNNVKFEHIEAVINIPKKELEYLNPQYKLGIIPGIAGESYTLTLPTLSIGDFLNNEQAIYGYKTEQERIDSAEKAIAQEQQKQFLAEARITHTVKNGEVLGLIAEKYHVKISDVRNWNNMANSRIYIGQKLTIYAAKQSPSAAPIAKKTAEKEQKTKDLKFRYHVIRSGDTLWDIAKLYEGVTINQIKELNQIGNAKKLKPGMKIKISPTSS